MELHCSRAEQSREPWVHHREHCNKYPRQCSPRNAALQTPSRKWDQATTTTSHTLSECQKWWFPKAELQKLKKGLKFTVRLRSQSYRLARSAVFPECCSFSWWVLRCPDPFFIPLRLWLCHLSSSQPFFVSQRCKLSFSLKSSDWWNSANTACLQLARSLRCLFRPEEMLVCSRAFPVIFTPLSQVYQLGRKSSWVCKPDPTCTSRPV